MFVNLIVGWRMGSVKALRMSVATRIPPRWFGRAAWVVHRALYAGTGGGLGLRRPTAGQYGLMRLRTVGRRTGEERTAILGYFEDGPACGPGGPTTTRLSTATRP